MYFYEANVLSLIYPEALPLFDDCPTVAVDFFDSAIISHKERWAATDYDFNQILEYSRRVDAQILKCCRSFAKNSRQGDDEHSTIHPVTSYLILYALVHENWHIEDMIATTQLLHYTLPSIYVNLSTIVGSQALQQDDLIDVEVPSMRFLIGASKQERFSLDSDKGQHLVSINSFTIGKYAVTNLEFWNFVEAGGYQTESYWSKEG